MMKTQGMSNFVHNFSALVEFEKFQVMLCPVTAQAAKITNRFIRKMFDERNLIDSKRGK